MFCDQLWRRDLTSLGRATLTSLYSCSCPASCNSWIGDTRRCVRFYRPNQSACQDPAADALFVQAPFLSLELETPARPRRPPIASTVAPLQPLTAHSRVQVMISIDQTSVIFHRKLMNACRSSTAQKPLKRIGGYGCAWSFV